MLLAVQKLRHRHRPGRSAAGLEAVGEDSGLDEIDGLGGVDLDGEDGEDGRLGAEDDGVVEDLVVYGQIYSIRDELLTVNVPVNRDKRRIGVELDENALVRIESDSLRNASIGDEIHVVGEAIELPRFFATEVTVTHFSENAEVRARTLEENRNVADAGGAGGGGAAGDDADAARPADPFDIVRREREEREAAGGRGGDAGDARDAGIYFGRLVRIN